MKKIIFKTTVFLLPILLLLIGVECLYQIVPNNYTLKNENIQKKHEDAQVLIFGNSHTFYGLNPKYFEKSTFNLSNTSQTLYFDQLLFEKHFDKCKSLQYVILNIEYTSLSQLDDSEEDVWRKYYYKRYMNLQVPTISRLDPKSFFISSTRTFYFNMQLVQRYFADGTLVDCDRNGFGINYTKEKRTSNFDDSTPMRVKAHEDNLFDFTHNTKRIQSIVDKCRSRDIQVILVTMPVTKGYARGVNQQKLSKIFKTCLTLEKANSNVRYLNLFKDSRFTDDDFYDPDHLHDAGAKKCSLIMNRFLSNQR